MLAMPIPTSFVLIRDRQNEYSSFYRLIVVWLSHYGSFYFKWLYGQLHHIWRLSEA